MKYLIHILTFILVFASCSSNTERVDNYYSVNFQNSEEIQNFILCNPESNHLLSALDSLKKRRKIEYFKSGYVDHGHYNCRLFMNNQSKILFNGQPSSIDGLGNLLLDFLTKEQNSEFSELENITINGLGQVRLTRRMITMRTSDSIPLNNYKGVILEINKTLNIIKETWSKKLYDKNLQELNNSQSKLLDSILKPKIVLEEYYKLQVPIDESDIIPILENIDYD